MKVHPKSYYATEAECYEMPWLRRCSTRQAQKKGVLGWRSF
jgi:hypothetical protein